MHSAHSSADPAGLWMSVSELAKAKGVSRQSMHERVARLEQQGTITLKAGQGRARLVNVAEFDRAAGESFDAVRSLNGTGAAPMPGRTDGGDPVLAREQARRAAYDADMKQMDLEERLGNILLLVDVQGAMALCAEKMVRVIEQLPSRSDDLAGAVGRDGAPGARAELKKIARELREALARAMVITPGDGPAEDAA